MQPSVSFVLIVRNEETKLPACLESIAPIAGEIIVVDTGSTDRTKEVATGFGAKVFEFPWIDHSLGPKLRLGTQSAITPFRA